MTNREAIEQLEIYKFFCAEVNIKGITSYNMAIKALEEQDKHKWIPVSERLPEEPIYREDSYLVQCEKIEEPFTAYWNGKKWTDFLNTKVIGVVAWMPLPDPWKGE